jgi:hypothetical protein
MEEHENTQPDNAINDGNDQPASWDLDTAVDLVLSELWDNDQDAQYDNR